jgi:phosphoribosylformylglycinamidine synthase
MEASQGRNGAGAAPRVLILRAPGTNCDAETAYAFELAGAKPTALHVNRLLENPKIISEFQILCLPGGFSYGDDLAAGRILGNQIRRHLAGVMQEFKAAGKLVLGICNGFQILMKSGLLVDDAKTDDAKTDDAKTDNAQSGGDAPAATLVWNASGKYEDRWVKLRVDGEKSVFLRGIREMYLPVAHAEGRFVARDAATLDALDKNGQLVLRYTELDAPSESFARDASDVAYPANPNGSPRNVAALCDETGRVMGLMPHPERHIDRTQHPRWTRGEGNEVGDGLAVFQNAVGYF